MVSTRKIATQGRVAPAHPLEETIETYVKVVKEKFKRHIDAKKLIEDEITDRAAPLR